MKFRARMVDITAMRDFMNISYSLSKLAKECIMRITTKKIYFIISDEDGGPRKPCVWCELPANFYFTEYSITGVNEEFNEIYLSLSTSMLSKPLSIVKHNIHSLKLKLTNKQMPCLTIEVEQTSDEGLQNRQCVHDIPIEVISIKYWNDYAEPHINDFHVSIQMPSPKHIKNIVDRMKNISHSLVVSANKHGRLILKLKTNMVTLSAHFPDLNVESFAVAPNILSNEDGDDDEEADQVSATVDIKKFLMFLYGMQLNNCKTVCSIIQENMVKLHLEQPGALSLQYFLTQIVI